MFISVTMKEIVSEILEWFFWEIYIDEETKVHAKKILLSVFSPLITRISHWQVKLSGIRANLYDVLDRVKSSALNCLALERVK